MKQVCVNVSGLCVETGLLAMMRYAAYPSLKPLGRVRANSANRLQARRFDCSFIFTDPIQTSVGELDTDGYAWLDSDWVWELPYSLGHSRAPPMRSGPACNLLFYDNDGLICLAHAGAKSNRTQRLATHKTFVKQPVSLALLGIVWCSSVSTHSIEFGSMRDPLRLRHNPADQPRLSSHCS